MTNFNKKPPKRTQIGLINDMIEKAKAIDNFFIEEKNGWIWFYKNVKNKDGNMKILYDKQKMPLVDYPIDHKLYDYYMEKIK